MAARYHVPPSELLALDSGELNLNILIFKKAAYHRKQQLRRLVNRKTARSSADLLVKMLNVMLHNAE